MTIKVLIIDDSPTIQRIMQVILSSDPDIEVVGVAGDPLVARELIKKLNPDVLTLDIEMPEMDGITFLRNLMRLRPMPVIMCSTLTAKGAEPTIEALQLGAIDYIDKPKDPAQLSAYAKCIIEKVKMAASTKVSTLLQKTPSNTALTFKASNALSSESRKKYLIALGASTGGVEALSSVLMQLPLGMPPIIVSQHIPKEFSNAFARRLNNECRLTVKEAEDAEIILEDHVYIAPGGKHLVLNNKIGAGVRISLTETELVQGHRPSVDVMFSAAADVYGKYIIACLLTGMGRDGADGLKKIFDVGGETIAQDKESSVVWGMPGAAVKLNAVKNILPLEKIAEFIFNKINM